MTRRPARLLERGRTPARRPSLTNPLHDLAIIIVSTNEARWLSPCLRSVFAHQGDVELDVVVADNQSTDGTRELVEREFEAARVLTCENHGFGHANNRAFVSTDARYVLFLNPDTEIVGGEFADLVAVMDACSDLGLVGVRQLDPLGKLWPTMRRFPSPGRAWGEALVGEQLPLPWWGERVLNMGRYDHEAPCDWTSGSFMLARREALESAGFFDERFFIYSEEPDLCLRIRHAGWEIRHLPQMTIVHHEGKAGISDRIAAQEAFARRQYAEKHFSPWRRRSYLAAVAVRYALRSAPLGRGGERREQRRAAARRALRTLVGRQAPPYGVPPPTAVISRRPAQRRPST